MVSLRHSEFYYFGTGVLYCFIGASVRFYFGGKMYKALYRKWRPKDFDDVCGQNSITDILKYEVANNKTSHAYLFCGSRGTGKTSCAKILAKAINCENPQNGNPCNKCEACLSVEAGTATDIIEMDAASNTGVDNVRDIKEEIVFTPSFLKYRVYIIDEVHMMSGGAFNALLKTLEEPPAHAVFILATTELHKLPSTIISRCQRFDFRRMSTDVIVDRLMYVSEQEGIDLDRSGARAIAKTAQGGMRDALSLLELCAGMKERIDDSLVIRILGVGNRKNVEDLVNAISAKEYSRIYKIVSDIVLSSKDLSVFWRELIDYYRDLMLVKLMPVDEAKNYLDLTDAEIDSICKIEKSFTMEQLLYHSKLLEDAFISMQKMDVSKQSIVELFLTRMCEPKLSVSPESMLLRISELEKQISMIKIGEISQIAEAPKPAPEKKAFVKEEKKVEADKEEKKEKASAEKQSANLRTCSSWSEIIEEISKTKVSLAGLMSGSKCYVSSDGVYVVKTKNKFIGDQILKNADALKCAILTVEGKMPSELVFETETEESSFSLIKELESKI